jgi:hypothetical protein
MKTNAQILGAGAHETPAAMQFKQGPGLFQSPKPSLKRLSIMLVGSLAFSLHTQAAVLLLLGLALAKGHAQEAPPTNHMRWLDPALMGDVTNSLGKVELRLVRLNALTNNAALDEEINAAKAELDEVIKGQVPKMIAGVSTAVKQNQAGLELARTKAGDTSKSATYIEKWANLRDRWQKILRSLDLQTDEVRAIQTELVKLSQKLDEERDYVREAIRVGEAEALNQELASFVQALAALRDRVAQVLGSEPPKQPEPRPQVSAN